MAQWQFDVTTRANGGSSQLWMTCLRPLYLNQTELHWVAADAGTQVPTKVVRYEAPKVREAPRPLRKPDAFATAPPTSANGSSRSALHLMICAWVGDGVSSGVRGCWSAAISLHDQLE